MALFGKPSASGDAERLYHSAVEQFGPALDRLARAYEADIDLKRDLLQEIHTALWISFRRFDQRCSLRTWVYRVAHNTAASHVARSIRHRSQQWVDLNAELPDQHDTEAAAYQRIVADQLLELVQQLNPVDRQVILLYLEGLDGRSIAEITGISASNVTMRTHRIKHFLVQRLNGGNHVTRPVRTEPQTVLDLDAGPEPAKP